MQPTIVLNTPRGGGGGNLLNLNTFNPLGRGKKGVLK